MDLTKINAINELDDIDLSDLLPEQYQPSDPALWEKLENMKTDNADQMLLDLIKILEDHGD